MNTLPSNDWTILIQINARCVAEHAGVEAASSPQVLKRPNQKGTEEDNKMRV